MPICPAKSYTLRYGLRTAIAILWFDGPSILEYNMTTCCYGPLKEDLTFVRMLLISSKRNIIACVRERLPSTVHMASRGPPFQTPPTISYGQRQTERQDVPHQLTWSAIDYTTEHLPLVKQLESTAMKGKFPTTAKFRRQRHGRVHPGATGGLTVPDASTAV